MLGIIVGLLLSWILLRLVTGKGLEQFFVGNWSRHFSLFFAGLLFSFVIAALSAALRLWIDGTGLSFNPAVSAPLLLEGIGFVIKSVVFEELLFRGAVFLIILRRFGFWSAVLLSSAGFGAYHWFTMGLLGSIIPMIFVFLMTGFMGAVWADAFVKSGSWALPVGLHCGVNLVSVIALSSSALGPQLFIQSPGEPLFTYAWVLSLLVNLFAVQLLTLLFVRICQSKRLFGFESDDITG